MAAALKLSKESVSEIAHTMNSCVQDTSAKPSVIYGQKKPGSAFSVVLPIKKRHHYNQEDVKKLLTTPAAADKKSEELLIKIPLDLKVNEDKSVTRTINMTNTQLLIATANEIDLTLNSTVVTRYPKYSANLREKYTDVVKHIEMCNNMLCKTCVMKRVLQKPENCYMMLNHTMRCNSSSCNIFACKSFKNYMKFKLMMTNIADVTLDVQPQPAPPSCPTVVDIFPAPAPRVPASAATKQDGNGKMGEN
jgi:hypothetical protein